MWPVTTVEEALIGLQRTSHNIPSPFLTASQITSDFDLASPCYQVQVFAASCRATAARAVVLLAESPEPAP